MIGTRLFRVWKGLAFLLLSLFVMTGCNLVYSGEEFTLNLAPDGSGTLIVKYKNFGSTEFKSHLRKRDLDALQQAPRNQNLVSDAAKVGVTLIIRRLELENYMMNGHMEANAKSYRNLFKYFTHYIFDSDEETIYIMPTIGSVTQGTISEPGVIVEHNGKVAFSWPKGTRKLSFKASYDSGGASFQYDLQKKYQQR